MKEVENEKKLVWHYGSKIYSWFEVNYTLTKLKQIVSMFEFNLFEFAINERIKLWILSFESHIVISHHFSDMSLKCTKSRQISEYLVNRIDISKLAGAQKENFNGSIVSNRSPMFL